MRPLWQVEQVKLEPAERRLTAVIKRKPAQGIATYCTQLFYNLIYIRTDSASSPRSPARSGISIKAPHAARVALRPAHNHRLRRSKKRFSAIWWIVGIVSAPSRGGLRLNERRFDCSIRAIPLVRLSCAEDMVPNGKSSVTAIHLTAMLRRNGIGRFQLLLLCLDECEQIRHVLRGELVGEASGHDDRPAPWRAIRRGPQHTLGEITLG